MKLKGEMVIELTDTNTGAVETVQETNMITEAVNNILGLNPMGIYLKASGEYDNSVLWNGTLLPICPNMIGGILLFPAVLEEKADHIYEQGKNLPVAYASNNVNSGSNVARGSLNQTESSCGTDQCPGRAECFWQCGRGCQHVPASEKGGYRGYPEGEADDTV